MMFVEAVRYVPRPRRLSHVLSCPGLSGLLLRCVHAQQVDRPATQTDHLYLCLLPIPARTTYISWMSCHVYLMCADVPQDSYE